MYDVIIVGARCAGAATAMLLARKGYRVLLVDRATFPSNVPRGHFIHRHGPNLLQEWGLLQKIVASGCPPATTSSLDFGDFPLVAKHRADGLAWGYGPRRSVLDDLLVKAAVAEGAELRERFVVESITAEAGRVAGIRGRQLPDGSAVAERAQITIGADGRSSLLAHAVQAEMLTFTPTLACWYFSYWSGVPATGLEVYMRPPQAHLVGHPTNDALFALFAAFPAGELAAVRSDIEANFWRAVELVPQLAERLRQGRREERFYGAAEVPNFIRRATGPGWALVGDAACHKDPLLALGICDALRDADMLSQAVDEGFSGRRSLDDALAAFDQRRVAATMPDYQENLHLARLEPLPREVFELRAALRGHQEDIDTFAMARLGLIPREQFFNPENLGRILGRQR